MSFAPFLSFLPLTTRAVTVSVAVALVVAGLTGCSSASTTPASTHLGSTNTNTSSTGTGSASTSTDSTSSTGIASTPPQVPAPGSTVAATSITTLDGIPAGLTLTIIAPDITGDAAADTTSAVAELQGFAELHGAASIRILPADATAPTDSDALLQDALADQPDVIVVLGEAILTALDSATASNLNQQFVLLGAQLPEPTSNVTAVVWPGADTRLADGISPEIAPRTSEALEAGLTAVAAEKTGLVLALR